MDVRRTRCTSGERAAIALFYVPLMFVMLFFETFSLVGLRYGQYL